MTGRASGCAVAGAVAAVLASCGPAATKPPPKPDEPPPRPEPKLTCEDRWEPPAFDYAELPEVALRPPGPAAARWKKRRWRKLLECEAGTKLQLERDGDERRAACVDDAGERHGWSARVDAGGDLVELVSWKHGVRDGVSITGNALAMDDTPVEISDYRAGARDGRFVVLRKAAVVTEGAFRDGKRDGCWYAWAGDRPAWRGGYASGVPIGTWETWLRPSWGAARAEFGRDGLKWRELLGDDGWKRAPPAPAACAKLDEELAILCLVTANKDEAKCLAERDPSAGSPWIACLR